MHKNKDSKMLLSLLAGNGIPLNKNIQGIISNI
jgi:hypothetical protein